MNSRKSLLAAVAIALAATAPAYADCVLPPAPSKIPDGATASEQEMIAAMNILKAYDGDVTTYLKCLEFEAKQNRLSKSDQDKMHNAAVDALTKVTGKFNEQVRVFKAKG